MNDLLPALIPTSLIIAECTLVFGIFKSMPLIKYFIIPILGREEVNLQLELAQRFFYLTSTGGEMMVRECDVTTQDAL